MLHIIHWLLLFLAFFYFVECYEPELFEGWPYFVGKAIEFIIIFFQFINISSSVDDVYFDPVDDLFP